MARRGQIELHAEVMLVGRKLPIENAPGRIGGRRQCLVGVLVVVEIFVQLEGDGFSWLPARAGHGDDLARGVILLVCLHGGGRVPVSDRGDEHHLSSPRASPGVHSRAGAVPRRLQPE